MERNSNLINIFNYKLYNYTNKTYLSFIGKIINSSQFKNSDIKILYLDNVKNNKFLNETFAIEEKGNIQFLHKYNLIKFIYSKNTSKVNSILNINIKNQKTYEVIKILEILQKKFFITNAIKDLKSISHTNILELHKKLFNSYLSKPTISYILNNTKYRDRNNKIYYLTYLTPKKHFLQYIRIKYILNIHPLASDNLLQSKLEEDFDINISTVQISKIRKKYFIQKKSKRNEKQPYFRFDSYFSKRIPFTRENIKKYKNMQAVYEFIDKSKTIEYNYSKCSTIYIGSTKDMYRRFNEYINGKGHTYKMKNYLQNNNIEFRFIQTKNYKEIERILLNEFHESCGGLPLLNINGLQN